MSDDPGRRELVKQLLPTVYEGINFLMPELIEHGMKIAAYSISGALAGLMGEYGVAENLGYFGSGPNGE